MTLRESRISASRNGWSGMLYFTGGMLRTSRSRYDDATSSIESAAAIRSRRDLIYALSDGRKANRTTIEFAVAASCLKHSISGDFNLVKLSEVEALLAGDGSGRVQR